MRESPPRARLYKTLQVRNRLLSLLTQTSGEQIVAKATVRSGMSVLAAQKLLQQKGYYAGEL